jgi:hypothetical protein
VRRVGHTSLSQQVIQALLAKSPVGMDGRFRATCALGTWWVTTSISHQEDDNDLSLQGRRPVEPEMDTKGEDHTKWPERGKRPHSLC